MNTFDQETKMNKEACKYLFFGPMLRGCPKRPSQTFFGRLFNLELDHTIRVRSVHPWAHDRWEVWGECTTCGARHKVFGVTDTTLIRAGFDLEVVKEDCRGVGRFSGWHSPDKPGLGGFR